MVEADDPPCRSKRKAISTQINDPSAVCASGLGLCNTIHLVILPGNCKQSASMRLLHAINLHFEDFSGKKKPPYAILSHRWGEEEISFQQMSEGKAEGPGLTKILYCCREARRRQLNWVWIDTCCINKENFPELSEAINSMYRWYQDAAECYVHLSDVSCERESVSNPTLLEEYTGSQWYSGGSTVSDPAFEEESTRSQWFTRGWTLQELLAPIKVDFYNRDWIPIGNRYALRHEIREATRIRKKYLGGPASISEACVAEKMSWLSNRTTSRIEDMSYCMLGLFNITLPLLYGEREGAFKRLQLEILRKSTDESIFVFQADIEAADPHPVITQSCYHLWGSENVRIPAPKPDSHPVLAQSPTQFRECDDVRRVTPSLNRHWEKYTKMKPGTLKPGTGVLGDRPVYSITNKGLKFRISPHISIATLDQGYCEVPLACFRELGNHRMEMCYLYLQQTDDNLWRRPSRLTKKILENLGRCDGSRCKGMKWPAIYLDIDQ